MVNGVTVSHDAIKRQIILSTSGRTHFELAKLRLFIVKEMNRQIKEDGRSADEFVIDDALVSAEIQKARDQVSEHYSDQDVTLEEVMPEMSSPVYLDNIRLTKLFARVFLPPNPHNYPPLTLEAIRAGESGDALLGALIESWDLEEAKRLAAGPDAPELPEDSSAKGGQQFMDMLLRQSVTKYLTTSADVRLAEDGIADNLVGIVDGVEITVDSIWPMIAAEIGPMDVWRAKRWFVNVMMAESALAEAGFLLTPEETSEIYSAYAEPYKNSFLSIEKIATVIKKFPTLGNYMTYYRLQESFRRFSAEAMTDEALEAQGDRKTSYLVSLAKVDVDVILLSAYDFSTKTWKENGWEEAERLAVEVAQKLAAGGQWEELLEEYSEFMDPPIPTEARNNPELKLKNKGRFRGMSRNDLLRLLEESDFTIFLGGTSVTDMVFFDQAVGTIENPIRGPHGWYLPRLLHKTPPTQRLSVADENHREYLTQDWLSDNLNRFVAEHVAKATVTGL